MVETGKEEAIFLWKVRHTDHGFVVRMLTQSMGIRPFLLQGIKGKKSALTAYMFPLAVLALETSIDNTKGIPRIKAIEPAFDLSCLRFDFDKNAIAAFLAEVLHRTLPEQEGDLRLYAFIRMAARSLAETKESANFHLIFLIQLTQYLGFYPSLTPNFKSGFLDFREGSFTATRPMHLDYIEPYFVQLWIEIMQCGFEDIGKIKLRRETRREILNQILRFYALHLQGMGHIRSLEVLEEMYK